MISLKTKKSKIILAVAAGMAVLMIVGLVFMLLPEKASYYTTGSGINSIVTDPPYGQRAGDYALLYEQEGLQACYMAYDTTTITADVDNSEKLVYRWENHVSGGEQATFYSGRNWYAKDGGFGYRLTEAGFFYERVGCNIPIDLSLNSMPDYTVEVVAKLYGVSGKDDAILYDGHMEYPDGLFMESTSAFRFGLLSSFSRVTGHVNSLCNLTDEWYLSNQAYWYHQGTDRGLYLGKVEEDGRRIHDPLHLIFDRTTTADSGCVDIGIKFRYEGDPLGQDIERSLKLDEWKNLEAVAPKDDAAQFSLMNNYPGTLYSVRVYDKLLDENTVRRNAFVDLCAFYNVNIAQFFTIEADQLDTFLYKCGEAADLNNVEMDPEDASHSWANRTALYEIINANWPK